MGKGHGGRLWFRKGASAPDAPYLLDLLDLILLRQARVIRAALEHGLLELPPLLSPEVLLAGSLVAPANSILAEIESGELCGRREPIPLAAGGVRVLAAHIGTRAALWPAPLLHSHREGPTDGEGISDRGSDGEGVRFLHPHVIYSAAITTESNSAVSSGTKAKSNAKLRRNVREPVIG